MPLIKKLIINNWKIDLRNSKFFSKNHNQDKITKLPLITKLMIANSKMV